MAFYAKTPEALRSQGTQRFAAEQHRCVVIRPSSRMLPNDNEAAVALKIVRIMITSVMDAV